MPISFNSASRCCSKYDFSAAGAALVDEEAGGRVVLDIFVFVLKNMYCIYSVRRVWIP